MIDPQKNQEASPRCVLCPAGCALEIAPSGPDVWRSEYPLTDSGGLCPRGGLLGELLSHRRRILWPAGRRDGALRAMPQNEAMDAVLQAAAGRDIIFCLDGNVPCEQLAVAAACCDPWPQAKLCIVVEPAEQQLLLGPSYQ